MAVAGVVLVAAGLLVTNELAPGPGTPAPLETGPGNGLAGQLLQSNAEAPPQEPSANVALPLPLQPAPASRATRTEPSAQAPAAPNVLSTGTGTEPVTASGQPTPTTTAPRGPTTTIPCTGLLGQTLQQAQLLPCRAAGGSLGSRSG
jgi:hypothetical protein